MRKFLLRLVGLVVVVAVIGFGLLRVPGVQDALLDRIIGNVIAAGGPGLADPDSLNIAFCGTGGPFADPDRAGPCTLVVAGDERFLVDTGTGGVQQLQRMRVPLGDLKSVFYTHLHSDHISGLGDVLLNSWAGGRKAPLELYGPPGVAELGQGFEAAFGIDSKSRIDHHGTEIFAPSAQAVATNVVLVPTRDDAVVVFENGDLKVTAFRVTHVPLENAYGYRFDYKGRSVVFSGDTVKDDNMVRFGAGADVMVHEAMGMLNINTLIDALKETGAVTNATILHDASQVHTSPTDAAEIANEAGVKLLIYSHIVPPMPVGIMEDRFMRGVSDVRADGVMLGSDGLIVRLPVGSSEIQIED